MNEEIIVALQGIQGELTRVANSLASLVVIEKMRGTNEYRAMRGEAPAYDEECFEGQAHRPEAKGVRP